MIFDELQSCGIAAESEADAAQLFLTIINRMS